MDKAQTLLAWSSEFSADQPDVAALLARAAAMLLSRAPRKVIDLPAQSEKTVRVDRLPPVVQPDFKMTQARAKVFKILQEMPGSTIREISVLTDRTTNSVGTLLAELEGAGLVVREAGIPNGTSKPPLRWFVRADKGREEIA